MLRLEIKCPVFHRFHSRADGGVNCEYDDLCLWVVLPRLLQQRKPLRGRARTSRSMKFVERACTPLASILGEYEHYAIFARPLADHPHPLAA